MKKILLTLTFLAGLIGLAFAVDGVTSETLTVTTQKRTWRIQLFTDYQTDYRAEFLREEIKTLPDGTVLAREQKPSAVRTLSAVAAQTVTLTSGKVLTGAEVAEALSKFGDKFADEDAAAAAATTPGN